ncbi:MAG: guanylate kinase [Candidatus Melainabacteria bacterium HGW-Melainabacteria-1]|nr:MAG: guanylate kinase [Candidatus Melainabacteria bacterium HGW-Melainabacteria-1]
MDSIIDDYIQRARQKYQGSLLVISGPSGVGKGTLVKAVLPLFHNLTVSVSMTTRKPRPGEVHGHNYFFVSPEEFQTLVREGAFLEHAVYNGHAYGTPRAFVHEQMRAGHDVILEIDVQGASQVRANSQRRTVQIFILPPGQAELKQRLEMRQTESAEVIAQRLAQVAKEVAELPSYDYYIINDQLDRARDDLAAIIRAERLRISA